LSAVPVGLRRTGWWPHGRSDQPIEFLTADPSRAQDVPEGASLDRLVAVDRHRDRVWHRRVAHDVVTASHALDVPALAFEDLDELLA
jgi:hypothetical protein